MREYMQTLSFTGLAPGEHSTAAVSRATFIINRIIVSASLACEVSLIVGNELVLDWVSNGLLRSELIGDMFLDQRQLVRAGLPITFKVRSNNNLDNVACLLTGPFADTTPLPERVNRLRERMSSLREKAKQCASYGKLAESEPESDDETIWESPTWDSD